MTRKVFWEDPYKRELETHIQTVNGDEVTLEATILYALSGGQESDTGTIGGYAVQEARKEEREIVYRLEPSHTLKPSDSVQLTLDWHRRYRLMRLHFAAEIILELVYKKLAGIEKIGAHIAEDKARIDFFWPENLTPLFPELSAEAQALIEADHPIESAFSAEAQERRYWKIESFAQVPCGGTHIKLTGEVGRLTLKRKNVGKGKERIEIYLTKTQVTVEQD